MHHRATNAGGRATQPMRLDEIEKAERRWRQRALFKERRTGPRWLRLLLVALAATVLVYYLFGSYVPGPFSPWLT